MRFLQKSITAVLVIFCLCVVARAESNQERNGYCEACRQQVSWNCLTETVAEQETLPAGHYYLSFQKGGCDWTQKTVSNKVCLDLNGMTVQGIHRVFRIKKGGELSVQGEGYLLGGGFASEVEQSQLIGGVALVSTGGVFNLYGGTLQMDLYKEEHRYSFNGGGLWVQGTFRMYGGRVDSCIATNAGGNVFVQTGGAVELYGGVLTGGSKRDVYCKGTALVEGDAVVGVIHMTEPKLTVRGNYTGYMVVSMATFLDGQLVGISDGAQLRYAKVSVSQQDNFLYLVVDGDTLKFSKYQPDEPVSITSRYCEACGRYADFEELNEYSGVSGRLLTGHYWLNFSQGSGAFYRKTLNLADRVCLDLNGMTLYTRETGFRIIGGSVLNIMDSAGGGILRREESSREPLVLIQEASACNIYGGELDGNAGCCVQIEADEAGTGSLRITGGAVKNGQILSQGTVTVADNARVEGIQWMAGEYSVLPEQVLQVEAGFTGTVEREAAEYVSGMLIGQTAGDFTGTVTLANDAGAQILQIHKSLVAVSGTPVAIGYPSNAQPVVFTDFSSAVAALSGKNGKILLLADVEVPVTVNKDVYVDLNGFSITGTISGNGIMYCMDSATADFTVADGIYGRVVKAANVKPVPGGYSWCPEQYWMVEEQGTLTFHCVVPQIQSMALRPRETGVYFLSEFSGDEMVQEQVAYFGVMLCVDQDPLTAPMGANVCRTVFAGEQFGADTDETSSMVYGIMKDTLTADENRQRATTPIYARAYIRMKDGQELVGSCCNRNLQEQINLANQIWDQLKLAQKWEFWNMFQSYRDVYSGSSWKISNLRNLENWKAACDAIDETVYEIPWQRDVVAEAKADRKIHYYFMSGEGLLISTTQDDPQRWGDACLVVFPDGQTMLIDCAPYRYGPVLLHNLKKLGIQKLDSILITHPHADHQGGAFTDVAVMGYGFLDKIPVGKIYYRGGYDPERADSGFVPSVAEYYGIACQVLERGNVLNFGDVRMEVIWPMAGDGDSVVSNDLEVNNFSIVFRLDYGEHSSLFTGDIYVKGTSGEALLLNRTDHDLLKADLLKVPHHGHDTSGSSSFLRAIGAQMAVATGSVEIPEAVKTRYNDEGIQLLGDREYGYIHVCAGVDGSMTTETSRGIS